MDFMIPAPVISVFCVFDTCLFQLKMAEKFEVLEQQLELFIENTRQLAIIVGDFQPQGQSVLNQKL